ncbi:type II toxin-antitoxin system PemK/MazF family toxin [Anaerocolumna sp. AGMB13025]|uniref:type II toxin-antitoxin system PemK/MazF family toxin n=1 Tax=Anaerocolumna sp. AGMB13025 TaxID=3039116 RepID=UPI00241F315F|nr:type II toxin-antitoxin system PemK/MazF family toxin [Anaerocolumna sp. AGMB13025]WFR57621.1 type II toxin-antitoxin system PemK/MazF family toxin [Anaerocolumna sp. AGMB13025]
MSISYDDFKDFMDWTNVKSQLKFEPRTAKDFPINYNCIYWAYLGCNIGSEEGKHRPVLVTRTYGRSTIVTVIPLTSQRLNDGFWYHVDLENRNSTALVEQMRTIDIIRIEKPFRTAGKIAAITEDDWKKINKQINYLYKLSPLSET